MPMMPNFYLLPHHLPLRWQDIPGELPPAILAYLDHRIGKVDTIPDEQLDLVRQYCEYYIGEGQVSEDFARLRERIKTIKTSDELAQWQFEVFNFGIDPLREERKMQEETEETQEGKARKERVQFDFSPDALTRLDALKTRLDADTRAEVIRRALMVLDFFVTDMPEDAVITVTRHDGGVLAKFGTKHFYGEVR